MTWFLTEAEAEELLLDIQRIPDYTYTVVFCGCGADAWGVAVHDANGVLITEAYSPGDIIPLRQLRESSVTEAEYRELLKKAEALGATTHDSGSH